MSEPALSEVEGTRPGRATLGRLLLYAATVNEYSPTPLSLSGQDSRRGGPHLVRGYDGRSLSIFAAMMKSLCVRPSILCVHMVISALPQVSRMSG